MKLFGKSKLKDKLSARNSGYRHILVEAPDFDGAIFMVFEPPLSDWVNYLKIVRDNSDDNELTEEQKIQKQIEAEAKLFVKCVRDENGDVIFPENEIKDLISSYGNAHSRLLEKGLNLLSLNKNPIELAEKKS